MPLLKVGRFRSIACLSNLKGFTIRAFQDKHFEKPPRWADAVRLGPERGRLEPFSTIGGEGYESFIGFCLINLDGAFVLDVPEQSREYAVAGRRGCFLDRYACFRRTVFFKPSKQNRGYSHYRVISETRLTPMRGFRVQSVPRSRICFEYIPRLVNCPLTTGIMLTKR